jgi:hypothetical protein
VREKTHCETSEGTQWKALAGSEMFPEVSLIGVRQKAEII